MKKAGGLLLEFAFEQYISLVNLCDDGQYQPVCDEDGKLQTIGRLPTP